MRKRLMTTIAAGVLGGALVLTGCSTGGDQGHQGHKGGSSASAPASSDGGMDHSSMEHPMDGAPLPRASRRPRRPSTRWEPRSR